MKFKVATATSVTTSASGSATSASKTTMINSDKGNKHTTTQKNYATTGSEILFDLGLGSNNNNKNNNSVKVNSPTSVSNTGRLSSKEEEVSRRLFIASSSGDRTNNNNNFHSNNDIYHNDDDDHDDDNSTIEQHPSSNKRTPGPVDVDTCTPILTPTERRNLRAMHECGYAHLRANELSQALAIFSEILRGRRERHGRKSLQAAVAMHNLGVVCMRSGRYEETVRLCDGAARIRSEKLGADCEDVACSLAQRGVAWMELGEYGLALESFGEALRIRKIVFGGMRRDDNDGEEEEEIVGHPLIVRLLNNVGCALFEVGELEESRVTFESALRMQRDLMRRQRAKNTNDKTAAVMVTKDNNDVDDNDDDDDSSRDPYDAIDPKDAYHTPLSIALALTNLGSIHLRLKEFDKSLVYFEEAVLIQESVLGEDHKIVINTKESIDFVIKSKDKQDGRKSPATNSANDYPTRIDRIAGILPYVSYERSKRIYTRVHHDISAAIDAVSSARCDQPFGTCAEMEESCQGGEQSFST
mmetsp:Transcript_19990/g.37604  ORF Transcript_19990/g.37604 Transcript_19990/m.37604 type:complete len:528 (+) Transcript_19990:332-1915(+)